MTRTADSLPDPLAYSVDGAAKAIGISERGVWRLIHDEKLPTFKLGARTLIPAPELRRFVDRLQGKAA